MQQRRRRRRSARERAQEIVGANGVPAASQSPPTCPEEEPAELFTIGAHEIEPQKVRWLWQRRIPIGKLTTWAGQTSIGKSYVTCDLAARLSVGGSIPFGNGECFEKSGTLILNTEDDYSDTIIPRLIDDKADLKVIRFMRVEKLYKWTLASYLDLEQSISEVPNCRLVVIAPSTSHLGGASADSNSELREMLMPLSLRSQSWPCAVIIVTHFNKGGANKVDAIARVIGSVAWVAAVRMATAFVPAPEGEDKYRALFVPLKSNLTRKP